MNIVDLLRTIPASQQRTSGFGDGGQCSTQPPSPSFDYRGVPFRSGKINTTKDNRLAKATRQEARRARYATTRFRTFERRAVYVLNVPGSQRTSPHDTAGWVDKLGESHAGEFSAHFSPPLTATRASRAIPSGADFLT